MLDRPRSSVSDISKQLFLSMRVGRILFSIKFSAKSYGMKLLNFWSSEYFKRVFDTIRLWTLDCIGQEKMHAWKFIETILKCRMEEVGIIRREFLVGIDSANANCSEWVTFWAGDSIAALSIDIAHRRRYNEQWGFCNWGGVLEMLEFLVEVSVTWRLHVIRAMRAILPCDRGLQFLNLITMTM